MQDRIFFRTPSQAGLFKYELLGQISDGRWENSSPSGHYHFWYGLDVNVDENAPRIEQTRWCDRNKYGCNRRDLVDVVGARMMSIAIMTKYLGYRDDHSTVVLEAIEHSFSSGKHPKLHAFIFDTDAIYTIDKELVFYNNLSHKSEYYQRAKVELTELREKILADYDNFMKVVCSYTYKDLMKDLKEIKNLLATAKK